MTAINAAKILILATDGYERSELRVPYDQLKAKGADVKIASIEEGEIKSWDKKNWGDSIAVDLLAKAVKAEDFDALVLPGGQINPDILRHDEDAMRWSAISSNPARWSPPSAMHRGCLSKLTPCVAATPPPIGRSRPTSRMPAPTGRMKRW